MSFGQDRRMVPLPLIRQFADYHNRRSNDAFQLVNPLPDFLSRRWGRRERSSIRGSSLSMRLKPPGDKNPNNRQGTSYKTRDPCGIH